jgi:hypothetical protein
MWTLSEGLLIASALKIRALVVKTKAQARIARLIVVLCRELVDIKSILLCILPEIFLWLLVEYEIF